MLGRIRGSFSRVVGFHLWKSMRDVEEWIEVEKGVKVKVVRPESPEEYHGRPPDRITIHILGRCWTIEIPRLFQALREEKSLTGETQPLQR